MSSRSSVINKYMDSFINACEFIIQTKCTIRHAAYVYGLSKSTLHVFIHEYFPFVKGGGKRKYKKLLKQLDYNWSVKHIRGGLATKKMYEESK